VDNLIALAGISPLEYSGDAGFDLGSPDVYDGWDGDNLYLTNGEKLSVPERLR
jgi:hypothetical protein